MEFLAEDDWVVKHKQKPVYLMVNHKWAFIVWECAKIQQMLKENACLVHVDTHLDDVPELVDNQKALTANTVEELLEIAYYERSEENSELELRMDNFIIPSFLRGTIQDIVYVSNPDNEKEANTKEITVNDMYEAANDNSFGYAGYSGGVNESSLSKCFEFIEGQDKTISRFMGVEAFLKRNMSFREDQTKILDLDLDYFNNSKERRTAELKDEEAIRTALQALKNYTDWDLITVALSPDFCGEYEDCIYLLKLFLEIFDLDSEEFNFWPA